MAEEHHGRDTVHDMVESRMAARKQEATRGLFLFLKAYPGYPSLAQVSPTHIHGGAALILALDHEPLPASHTLDPITSAKAHLWLHEVLRGPLHKSHKICNLFHPIEIIKILLFKVT